MLQRIAVLCFLTVFLVAFAGSSRAASWYGFGPDQLWTTTSNWQFGNNPYNSPVTIGNHFDSHDDTTLVNQFFEVDSLTLSNGADVVLSPDGGTTSYALQVHGHVSVSSLQEFSDSIITVYDSPTPTAASFWAETMQIAPGGRLRLDSVSDASPELAIVDIVDGLLDNIAGTRGGIYGNGLIRLKDDVGILPTTLLNNDSIISAGYINSFIIGTPPPATTLQITATAGQARFDWDGNFEAGTLQVNGNATLDIDVRTGNDAFDGTMNLSTGSTIDIAHAWTFGDGGGTGSVDINVNTQTFAITPIGQDPVPGPAAHIAGANWTMVEGTINLADKWDTLHIDSAVSATGGTIENAGTLVFNANASFGSGVDFNMNGGGASLVVNAGVNIATPDFNLDGSGQFENVTTINSGGVLNMALGAGADEDFNHTINLNGGQLQVATTDNDWNLESSGKINAAGGGTSTISGETFNVHGKIDVSGNSVLQVSALSRYNPTANVVIEAGSTLDQSTVSYDGGSYTGGGILKKGKATIREDTTWNVAVVDIDDGTTTINNGATLVVNADSIDSSGDGIDSNINIAATGVLTFNLSGGAPVVFDSAGSIDYIGTGVTRTFLTGSDITMNGTLFVHGDGRSTARLDIGGTVEITDAGIDRPFRLGGGTHGNPNILNGGTVIGGPDGPGILAADDGKALHGFGTLDVDIEFIGNSNLIAENGELTMNGDLFDVGRLGTSGAAAVLDMNIPWNTNSTEQVLLQGGVLQGGATITNDGVNGIDGFGEVTAKIINNTRISANGGTMIYNQKTNDWDGTTNTGQIIADNGNVELQDTSEFLFNGTVQAGPGREVVTNGFSLEFSPTSSLILTGGTYRSSHSADFGGSITTNAGSDSTLQIGGTATIQNSSTTNLLGNLQLDNLETVVEPGATFAGGGSLISTTGNTLRLLDGADVDVLLENNGTLALGNSPGQTTGLDFQQNAIGIWDLEIGGLGLNDFDRMNLTGLASLDGTLDLSLITGYVPTLGDTLNILSASGGVSGMFASIMQPGTMPSDLIFDINYLGSIVQLEVVDAPVYTADFDNDGDVDAADLAQWQGDFGGPGSDSDGDGDSDGFDFLAWQQQAGSGVSVVAASSSVPEPSTLFLTGLAASFGLLMPRRRNGVNI